MKKERILVTGACGPIGAELTKALRKEYGEQNVVATDINVSPEGIGNYIQGDVMCHDFLDLVIREREIGQVYHFACGHCDNNGRDLKNSWDLNVHSLLSLLKIAQTQKLDRIFWPSSIAAIGSSFLRGNGPQNARTEPSTACGISKGAGEFWCKYYFDTFGIDVRSIRYPMLISPSNQADKRHFNYAAEMTQCAFEGRDYSCFLKEDTCLPMMYMPDAVRAAIELMEAPAEKIRTRSSYNLAAMSFAPCDLAALLKELLPGFIVTCQPDFRQAIADGLPASICDNEAREDWGWKPEYDLKKMTLDILGQFNLKNGYASRRKAQLERYIEAGYEH